MKKILAPAIFASLFATNPALAKTEGSYLGIDFLSTRTSFYTKVDQQDLGWVTYKPTQYGSTYGVGLNYKYAFNMNGFFIAPGLIAEQDSFGKTSTKGTNEDSLQVKNRYGAKLDFGYDIAEFVAPYLTVGYAAVNYKSVSNGLDSGNNVVTSASSGTASGAFIGGGLQFALGRNFALNFEYNLQKFTAKPDAPKGTEYYLNKYQQIGRMDVAKIGISYHF